MSIVRALEEFARGGNAHAEADEVREAASRGPSYGLGYVYGRTRIDQMYDPPDPPVPSDSEAESYARGWLDAHVRNTAEELGEEFARQVQKLIDESEGRTDAVIRWLEDDGTLPEAGSRESS